MDTETIFFTLFVIWYFKQFHSSHHLIVSSIHFLKTAQDSINYYNELIRREISNYNGDSAIINDDTEVEANNVENTPDVVVVKYEDKYLQEVRRMDREFHFDDHADFEPKMAECLESINASTAKRRDEISKILGQIDLKLQIYEGVADDYVFYNDNNDDDSSGQTKEEKMKELTEEKTPLLEEDSVLLSCLETPDGQAECAKQAREEAIKFFLDKKVESLGNCCVMEHTPLGNVVMLYDKVRETFKYYSDNTIPYRYLEVVARKYVKQFNCRPIFVDMDEEIQLAEKQNQERKEKEESDKKKKEEKPASQIEEKRNVFAKFKSYNKEAGTGHVNTGAPPKNSLPNKSKNDKPDADYILKNNANRFTYEGRLANFSFIKKVDRKVVDKKAAMTFADFKKMKL
jgi:hypothetical protein